MLPAECVPGGAFAHTIAIYTNGAHFEALRDDDGYTFSERKIGDFIRRSENVANARQGVGNNGMAEAIAESLKEASAKSAKKPALNRRAIANSIGIPLAELNAYTNAELKNFIGGGKRRTRRRTRRRRA